MKYDCTTCKRFPCGNLDCNALEPVDCEQYLEAEKTMSKIIINSLDNLWAYGIDEVKTKFNTNYGNYKIKKTNDYIILELHTGGWSDNERLIETLGKSMFWTFFWYESKRGGYYLFKRPRKKRKYERKK